MNSSNRTLPEQETLRVIPFHGLRYNRDLGPDLSRIASPPYDIISPRQQLLYHQKHPNNAINLDFGLTFPGDNDGENRYTRAAGLLRKWLDEKILLPESVPAVYLLREEYQVPGGGAAVREGLIAAIRLSDFREGKILPHEETAAGPKQDRLRLIEATQANLSPIFCLYSDPADAIVRAAATGSGNPDAALIDEAGTRHSLWVLKDGAADAACRALSGKTLLIADGHHRYETMLAYRDRRRAQEHPGSERPYDFTMAYLTNMDNDSRWILPVHRFVSGLAAETLAGFKVSLGRNFEIKDVEGSGAGRQAKMVQMMARLDGERNAFGLYLADSGSYHVLVARRPRPLLPESDGRSAAFRSLDIAVLDNMILAGWLGIAPGGAGAWVEYVERTDAAFKKINKKGDSFQIGLFVNPVSMTEIKAVAAAGEKMPPKSTYFYPKPLTGLVFRSLNI